MIKGENPFRRSDWFLNIWSAIKDLQHRVRKLEEKLPEKEDKSLR